MEVKERWGASHSRPEASTIDWFTFDQPTLSSVIFAPRRAVTAESWARRLKCRRVSAAGDGLFTHHTSLHEMWRMRGALLD